MISVVEISNLDELSVSSYGVEILKIFESIHPILSLSELHSLSKGSPLVIY